MTPNEHRLTIGLPVYNAERYLESAAESILAQTYENFDLLIADNASTDRTQTICRELSRRDSRVRYVRHAENIGVVPNHNFTAEAARGEFFRWAANTDDLIEPTALEKCVALLDEEGSGTVLAFPQTEVIGEHGEHVMYWSEQGSVTNDAPDEQLRALLEHPRGHLRLRLCALLRCDALLSVLHNTRLLRYFYPADVVLIVELVLRGKSAEVPEPLI